jgi:tetratricopeptide (TPR) repeat protein
MAGGTTWHRFVLGIGGVLGVLGILAFAPLAVGGEAPARVYSLARAPLEIFDQLPQMEVGPISPIGKDERALLAAAWERKSQHPLLAANEIEDRFLFDALLFASGIVEVKAREDYRRRFDQLAAGACKAVGNGRDPLERGEKLMGFLHKGVMKGGYKEHQTSLAGVFDTGTFNCVSSTALYYLLGRRLGLELRPISIPANGIVSGHASLDMIVDGRRIEVEPTNPDGFDWQTKIHRPNVIILGFVPDRKQGHEVDGLGIASLIAYNRGVDLLRGNGDTSTTTPDRFGAARCFLAALALDPTNESATNNVLSIFTNWGPQLSREGKFEAALRVLDFGLRIAPGSKPLSNNRNYVWQDYIEARLGSDEYEPALKLIRRAAGEPTTENDLKRPGYWFVRHAEKRLGAGWEAGLDAADRGSKLLSAAEAGELNEWRTSAYRRWSQSLLKNEDVEGSLKVLTRAYALDPHDRELIEGIALHTQEALKIVENRSGLPAMIEHYQILRRAFPDVDAIAECGRSHALRAMMRRADAKEFPEAVAVLDRYRPLLKSPEQCAELGGAVYDRWARSLAEDDLEAALAKYVDGLKVYPGQHLLVNNAIALVDKRAFLLIKEKPDEAIRLYNLGLKYFKGNDHLLNNLRYCEESRAKRGE